MQNEIFEVMPVRKAYMKMALPVVLSMVVTLIYNMVDTFFIAKTGNTNLVAGVSLGAPIFTLMIALGDILGLGGSSVISRLFGEQRVDDGKRLSVFCFYGSLLGGLIVTAILLVFRTPILNLLGADSETFRYTSQYYTFIALGAPFLILNFTPTNLLRSEGLATQSMIGSMIGTAVNIVLDPVFIFGLNMGAGGAAAATVIGYICADLYFIWVLLTKSRKLSMNPKLLRISASELGAVFAIGFPASITNIMQSIGICCHTAQIALPPWALS
ncbi:MAG: MATE family efflux transporter [Eubacteriales bacterium]|nr:MATE family efflux transporter [Eubacteriales bacterium]